MKNLTQTPLWLISGILYGLSWPILEGINLSFLAWFAFVPLFLYLEKNQHHFWKNMAACYAAMVVFGCFSAAWLFNFPKATYEIAIIFFLEEVYFTIPFLLLFLLKKRFGFERSLWLFPLIWMLWEWIYLDLEFTMGTHLSAYSQSSNIWLIQYVDLTGMWGLSFWLMLFNVLLYKIYKKAEGKIFRPGFLMKTGKICLVMLGVPMLYSVFALQQYQDETERSAVVSLIPTQFSGKYLFDPQNQQSVVEQTLHRTDSLAFSQIDLGGSSDLYVWPETGMSYDLNYSNLGPLLRQATQDWDAALLTGCQGKDTNAPDLDPRSFVSGALIDPQGLEPLYHHKTVLTPGQEVIPYHAILAKLPSFPIPEMSPNYFKRGQNSLPLELRTKDRKVFNIGVSLCYEQWYPQHWARLAKNGTDFYIHLAGESWYGNMGFQTFMANVSRMRCIENRRQGARCANMGQSMFIDQFGRKIGTDGKGAMESFTEELKALDGVTPYAQFPNAVPILGMIALFFLSIIFSKSISIT